MTVEKKFLTIDNKIEQLREMRGRANPSIVADFDEKLDVSWIYHDNALEGVVLSYSELKAAIDSRIISDVTLIPMYEEVRNHKLAVDFVRDANTSKKPTPIDIELVRKLYALLTPEAAAKAYPYRRENPLHRLYYHEIAAPEKISYKMRKLDEWLKSEEFQELHPIKRATKAHFKLLNIYPWTKNSGKVARLLMNYILIRHGYLPAVIHSIERQRYYEVLRFENEGLLNLVVESLENAIETTAKFLEEVNGLRVKRAS